MTGGVGPLAALGAGVVSFLSPCVLPLVPGYLSFLAGTSVRRLPETGRRAGDVLLPAALFVLGFSAVFVALGVSASLIGGSIVIDRALVSRASGAFILLFGFLMLGIVKAPWLHFQAGFDLSRTRALGRWAPPVMGMAFGFAWTPCVGPILGSILMLAARSGHAGEGAALLAAYSLGLGIPFLLSAVLLERLSGLVKWLGAHSLQVSRVSGIVLMVLGALIVTDSLGAVTAAIARLVPLTTG